MADSPWWEAAYLKALGETGIAAAAARAAGIGVRAAYKRRKANQTFAAAWDAAAAFGEFIKKS